MCHEWWPQWADDDEETRRMWEEFERTPAAAGPEVPHGEPELTLEELERAVAGTER